MAGDENTISAVSGSADELRPVGFITWKGSYSTTTDSYEIVIPGEARPYRPLINELTNSQFAMQLSLEFSTIDGGQASARILQGDAGLPGSEVTKSTEFEQVDSDVVSVSSLGRGVTAVELKSGTAGQTAEIRRIRITVYEMIGDE